MASAYQMGHTGSLLPERGRDCVYVKKRWRWIGNLAFTVNLCCFHPQLVGVDVMAALDMYAEQEQWEKCLEVAAKQVSTCVSPQQAGWGCWLSEAGPAGMNGQRQISLLFGEHRESLQQLKNHLSAAPILARHT